ncbi:MAG: hypothetical protein J0I66_04140, partial [Microbacterium sp.]|nr:hypothetical protein [Microbacterium sp.]
MTTSVQTQVGRQDVVAPRRRRRRRASDAEAPDRGILSRADWRRPHVRILGAVLNVLLGIALVAAGLLP